MFCTKCGNMAPEGARFCRTCGQPLEGAVASAAEIPPLTPSMETAAGPSIEAPVPVSAPPVAAPPMGRYAPPVAPPAIILPAPYAGFWLRVVAYLIDGAIMGVVFGAIIGIALATLGVGFFRGLARPNVYDRPVNPFFPAAVLGVIFVLLPITIVVTWLYFASMESSERQGTLGKMALGLFVTDMYGKKISFARASGRFFAKFITGLIPFFIGYIMAGFTEKKQALHDMIASCLVLKKV
ncbi:MAG TPA: RDD family protein [Candidatus Acidoferrales bacterium]|nr:RDD family protein [Candidatus Acidoferrales bacterium]